MTGHRRENYGDGFRDICEALLRIANEYKNVEIIFPVHLNPNVKDVVEEKLSKVRNIF